MKKAKKTYVQILFDKLIRNFQRKSSETLVHNTAGAVMPDPLAVTPKVSREDVEIAFRL